jgi:sugar-specific transcriptional regulator TrmB
MQENILQELGLDGKSTAVYLAALECGESLIMPLAHHAHVKRPTLYEILPKLHEIGLISYGRRGKRRTVIAQDPSRLLALQQERTEILKKVVPELISRKKPQAGKPKVSAYEGIEGVKQVYEDTLIEDVPMRSFLQPQSVNPEIERYLTASYMPRRVKHGVRIKNLVSGKPGDGEALLQRKGFHRENRYVDGKEYPAEIEMMIYSNKVAFVTYGKDSDPTGIIIESKEIAQTLRSLHALAWQVADKEEEADASHSENFWQDA